MLNHHFKAEVTATPDTATAYKVVLLTPRHAKAISGLIDHVRSTLPDDERHFLKPRTQGNVSAHFAAYNPAFGIFNRENQLVACALLVPLADATDEHNQKNYPAEHLLPGHWALQSVARHPDYKGHGLMEMLLAAATTYAKTNAHVEYVVAKVNDRNAPSKAGFLNAGFTPAAQGQDQMSGEPVVYLGLHTGSGLARHAGQTLQSGHDDPKLTPLG